MECRRYRIEVYECRRGGGCFHVRASPVEYLGREEFKRWARLCERNFMTLVSRRPWCYEAARASHEEALRLARRLAEALGEPVFFDAVEARFHLVALEAPAGGLSPAPDPTPCERRRPAEAP
jgi:CelD/BcsL family acetyltransferase involved in cellulose biosynthesis